jgi:hypothetical protein
MGMFRFRTMLLQWSHELAIEKSGATSRLSATAILQDRIRQMTRPSGEEF